MEASLLTAGILEARGTLFRTLHGCRFLLMGWDVVGEGWDFGVLKLGVLPHPEERLLMGRGSVSALVTGINQWHPRQGACELRNAHALGMQVCRSHERIVSMLFRHS